MKTITKIYLLTKSVSEIHIIIIIHFSGGGGGGDDGGGSIEKDNDQISKAPSK